MTETILRIESKVSRMRSYEITKISKWKKWEAMSTTPEKIRFSRKDMNNTYHIPMALLQAFVTNGCENRQKLSKFLNFSPNNFCYTFSTRVVAQLFGKLVKHPPRGFNIFGHCVSIQIQKWPIIPSEEKRGLQFNLEDYISEWRFFNSQIAIL